MSDSSSEIAALCEMLDEYDVLDLSHTLEEGMPVFPSHAKYFQNQLLQMGDPAAMNQVTFSEHTGTHVDSPSHFVLDTDDPRCVPVDKVEIEKFVGRAVKLTFGPFTPTNALVTRADIVEWEAANVDIVEDDIVLCDFQWASRWKRGRDGWAFMQGWPGLAADAVDHLVGKGVKAVGTDCISLDSGDGAGETFPSHRGLLPRGILIFENVANLARLPVVSVFVGLPLKMAGGTGSPVRAIAFVPRA